MFPPSAGSEWIWSGLIKNQPLAKASKTTPGIRALAGQGLLLPSGGVPVAGEASDCGEEILGADGRGGRNSSKKHSSKQKTQMTLEQIMCSLLHEFSLENRPKLH